MRIIGAIVGGVVVLALSACGGGDGGPSAEATADGTVIPAAVVEAMAVSQGEFFIRLWVDEQLEEIFEPTLNADGTRFSFTRTLPAGNHRFAIDYLLRTPDPTGGMLDIPVQHYETGADFVLLAGSEEALELGSPRMPLTHEQDEDGDGASNLLELREGVYFLSNNADLSALGIEGDSDLVEPFDPGLTDYTARLPSAQTSVAVTAEVSEAGATFRIFECAQQCPRDQQGLIDIDIDIDKATEVPPGSSAPITPGDNEVIVIVTSQDGHTEKTYAIAVNRNRPPSFEGDGTISLAENTESVPIEATDPDGDALTVRITGGADQDKFSTTGGALAFKSAPDFEVPLDADTDNVYEVRVEVDDGRGEEVVQQELTVAVSNVNRLKVHVSYPPAGGNLGGKAQQSTVTGNLFDEEDGIVTLADLAAVDPMTLTVNGISVSEDDFEETSQDGSKPAHWSVRIPVGRPTHELNVSVESSSGHVDSITKYTVINQALLLSPEEVSIDGEENEAIVLDTDLNALIAVDLDKGSRRVVSDGFENPTSLVVDQDQQRRQALVVDGDELTAVGLESGIRRVFSGPAQDVDVDFGFIQGILLDTANDRALLVDVITPEPDEEIERVIAINLSDGKRTPLFEYPSPGDPISGIVLDTRHNRLLEMRPGFEGPSYLLAVDLDSQEPITPYVFSRGGQECSDPDDIFCFVVEEIGTGPGLAGNPITLDAAPNRYRLLTSFGGKVLAVDLDTGNRTELPVPDTSAEPTLGRAFRGITMDTEKDRVLVVDVGLDAVIALDPITGARSIVSESRIGDGPSLSRPKDIALDTVGKRAFVTDLGLDAVFEVDLTTGNRTVLSDAEKGTGEDLLGGPYGIAFDEMENRVLVTDQGLDALVEVDLEAGKEGNRKVLWDGPTDDQGFTFWQQEYIALDRTRNRVRVLAPQDFAVLAIDLVIDPGSGVESGVGSFLVENIGNPFFSLLSDIAVDAQNEEALIADNAVDQVIAVDLDTGTTRVVSKSSEPQFGTGDNFEALFGLAFDAANRQVFVASVSVNLRPVQSAVIAVPVDLDDLDLGTRRVRSDAETGSGAYFPGIRWEGMTFDAENNVILTTESSQGLLMVIEAKSGERAILSK